MDIDSKKKKSEYRNSVRSRSMIRSALLSLMQEKEFSKITVTDIVARADINRGTFYAHFRSPEDVLAKIQHDFFSGIESLFNDISPLNLVMEPYPVLMRVSDYIMQDKIYYQNLLVVTDKTMLLDRYIKQLTEYLSPAEILNNVKNKNEYMTALYFLISGTISLYLEALRDDNSVSLEEIPAIVAKYVNAIMKTYIS